MPLKINLFCLLYLCFWKSVIPCDKIYFFIKPDFFFVDFLSIKLVKFITCFAISFFRMRSYQMRHSIVNTSTFIILWWVSYFIFIILNNAARLLIRARHQDHITPISHRLHCLPVETRVKYTILSLVHLALHRESSCLFKNIFVTYMTHVQTWQSCAIFAWWVDFSGTAYSPCI